MANSGKPTIWTRNFICVLVTNCMLVLSHTSVNTLVSSYTKFLDATPTLMGLLTGLFFGVALAMRPVAGPVTTRVDNRRLMMIVYALGMVVNLGYALFHTIPVFVVFRVLNGFQYAFVGSLGITIASESLPKEKLSSGLGIYGVSGSIASAIAPKIGISLKAWGEKIGETVGAGWSEAVNKTMGPVLAKVVIPEDIGFTCVFVFAALALAVGLIPSALMHPTQKSAEQLKSAGKWYQTILSKHAVIPSIVVMLLTISFSLFNAYMVLFGEEELGISDISLFFTVLALVMLASRPICGSLSDRVGASKVFLPGTLLFAVSFLCIGFARDMTLVLTGAVLAAVGYGAANPTIQSVTMQTETKIRGAVASNTMFIGMDVGYFIGPLIGGYIRDAGTYRDVMRFGCLPAVLGGVLFLITMGSIQRRIRQVEAQEEQSVA